MDMKYIRMTLDVVIEMCFSVNHDSCMTKEDIFLVTSDGIALKYVGKYDFSTVCRKARLGNRITIGIDPSVKYCALTDDIIAYQLR